MSRHYGLPPKGDADRFHRARDARPVMTLCISAVFGVIGAAVAAISFNEARSTLDALFHGPSLVAAVLAAGFGCWTYVWIARPRFAAHFSRGGDAFSDLLRFYARAALALLVTLCIGRYIAPSIGSTATGMILCAAGGAGCAAAFQTVLTFVPAYEVQ
ncbi:MAG: hypothetical protein AAF850_12070 [Pseudomonadota bacterium]